MKIKQSGFIFFSIRWIKSPLRTQLIGNVVRCVRNAVTRLARTRLRHIPPAQLTVILDALRTLCPVSVCFVLMALECKNNDSKNKKPDINASFLVLFDQREAFHAIGAVSRYMLETHLETLDGESLVRLTMSFIVYRRRSVKRNRLRENDDSLMDHHAMELLERYSVTSAANCVLNVLHLLFVLPD